MDLQHDHLMAEAFAPDTRRQHVMAEAIKFEAEMLMAWDSRSQPLPTQLEYPLTILPTTNTTHYQYYPLSCNTLH